MNEPQETEAPQVQYVDVAKECADYALILMARHTPARIGFGRPLAATPDPESIAVRVLTTTGLWFVPADGKEVDRLDDLGDDRSRAGHRVFELVTFRNGEEIKRVIDSIDYDSL
jgi:hypothetical protein